MNLKKYLLYALAGVGALTFNGCSDELNTEPTDQVSGSQVFADATSAEAAINGVYRLLYVAGWSSNWSPENFGQTAVNLLADLMAEDHIQYAQGQGWFYEDYRLNVHGDFSNTSGRPYAIWNFYYTLISNLNYIIASEETMAGEPSAIENLVGQAYAMRAFCYFYLIQFYQQTYVGHEDAPGVPVYTEPTIAGSEGQPRGTVQGVYDQINADLARAVELLQGKTQEHSSHVDYYVAKGFQARVALVQHHYADAAAAAAEALSKPGLELATVEALGGNNSVDVSDVMWGMEITADQTTQFSSFFSHMDADAPGMYGETAQKCISSGLYRLIPETDSRLAWFHAPQAEEGTGSNISYCQLKFKMADYTTRTGDYVLMRAEEMVLIKAEAECHEGQYAQARETISQLGDLRDTNFAARLASRTDANTYNQNTNDPLRTLMDEILFAASPLFIFPLPQSEIDGNENISDADQNPIVQ